MRRAGKLDSNQKAIQGALEARGHQTLSLASLGSGAPDLLVGAKRPTTRFINGTPFQDFDRVILALEIKSERNQRGELHKLTPLEQQFHQKWKGWPIAIVGSVEEAIRVVEGGP